MRQMIQHQVNQLTVTLAYPDPDDIDSALEDDYEDIMADERFDDIDRGYVDHEPYESGFDPHDS